MSLPQPPPSPPPLSQLAFGDGTPKKALLTSLLVGTILIAINHGDFIMEGHWPSYLKVLLTYCVPYCVTTWGAIIGKRAQWRRSREEPSDTRLPGYGEASG